MTIEEAEFLSNWMKENNELLGQSHFASLGLLLEAVLDDGIIDGSEQQQLLAEIRCLSNPISCNNAIAIEGKTFCLSGDFEHGDKESIADLIEQQGGVVSKGVKKTCSYVVVGGQGSDRYKYGSYGTKVVKAMELQEKGVPIQIITEQQLFSVLV